MSEVPKATVTSRSLPSLTGPEGVAAVLSVLVVVAVALLVGPLQGLPGAVVAPTPAASAAVDATNAAGPLPSTGAGSSAGASASPDAGASAGAGSSAEPSAPAASATLAPFAGSAGAILREDARLVTAREALQTTLANDGPTTDIVRQLRSMNTMLGSLSAMTTKFDGSSEAEAIVADLVKIHTRAAARIDDTLGASIQNRAANRSGAADTVKRLRGLEAAMARLADVSGLPAP